jgi:sulfane dehydrogenase subunit SoxC
LADSLADVPPREPGAPLSGHSERSQYVHLSRIPEAGPGQRHVDPVNAINSKTPLNKLVGSVTPADLHYERSHAGVPDLDPAKHRLLIHGMVQKPQVLTVDDLMAMPSVSRIHFIECTGNGWENWKNADPTLTVQNTHGLVSTNEWTGVPLRFLIDLVDKDRGSTWMLAEGGDGAAVDRSIPLTDEIVEEAFVAYGQNGEPLRPAHGFPTRLIMPGFEGNLNIKWLRRLKFGDRPWMTRWETARYTRGKSTKTVCQKSKCRTGTASFPMRCSRSTMSQRRQTRQAWRDELLFINRGSRGASVPRQKKSWLVLMPARRSIGFKNWRPSNLPLSARLPSGEMPIFG